MAEYWTEGKGVDTAFVRTLGEKHKGLDGKRLLEVFLRDEMPGKVALVSSFGTEAAVLLHMVSEIDKDAPVVFLDTKKHFPSTLAYKDDLVARLGLTQVIDVTPDPAAVVRLDKDEYLWLTNPDACCDMRKTQPLDRVLAPYHGWITGRKRAHGGERAQLPLIEGDNGRVKINPLAHWTPADVNDYFEKNDLPRHPLVAEGYTSIGCANCSIKPTSLSDPRSGRWAHKEGKTECGIHLAQIGTPSKPSR